jgi:hypothetical protein
MNLSKFIIGALIWIGAQKFLNMFTEQCIKPNIYTNDPKRKELATSAIEIILIIAIIAVIQKIY